MLVFKFASIYKDNRFQYLQHKIIKIFKMHFMAFSGEDPLGSCVTAGIPTAFHAHILMRGFELCELRLKCLCVQRKKSAILPKLFGKYQGRTR